MIHWVFIFIICIQFSHLLAKNIYVSGLTGFNKAQNSILTGTPLHGEVGSIKTLFCWTNVTA